MKLATVSIENEHKIWIEYKKTNDKKLREILIVQYLPLVKFVAGKISVMLPPGVNYDDIIQEGSIGLMDAIDKFEPNKNVKFKTYATTRIHGAIIDWLRSLDILPRSLRQKAKEIEDANCILEARLGRAATDIELAENLDTTVDDINSVLYRVNCASVISLNDRWYSGDDNDNVTLMDTIESPANMNPDVVAERAELTRLLASFIGELPEKEKLVLVLYHYENLTLKEIGRVLNVTESRVSQLNSKAMMRLRAKLSNAKKGIL